MQQPDLLLDLPTWLSVNLFALLSLKDRVRLDSAYCHLEKRVTYLELISNPECTLKACLMDTLPNQPMTEANKAMAWAISRNISVEKALINPCSNMDVLNSYLQRFGRSVLDVRVDSTLFQTTSTVPLCVNLMKLTCCSCEIGPSLRNVFTTCLHLREFHCKFIYDGLGMRPKSISHTDLQGIECPSLHVLSLVSCYDDAVVAEFLRLAVRVEVLMLSGCKIYKETNKDTLRHLSHTVTSLAINRTDSSTVAWHRLAGRCPNIVHLDVADTWIWDPVDVRNMVARLPHLKSINLSSATMEGDVLAGLVDVRADTLAELLVLYGHNITSAGFNTVLPLLTKLTTLSLHCNDVSLAEWDFTQLARYTTLLIHYSGTRGRTFVHKIATHCTALEHCALYVDDFFCPATAFDKIVKRCVHLSVLNIIMGRGPTPASCYTPDDVARWRAVRPNLVVQGSFQTDQFCIRRASPLKWEMW